MEDPGLMILGPLLRLLFWVVPIVPVSMIHMLHILFCFIPPHLSKVNSIHTVSDILHA